MYFFLNIFFISLKWIFLFLGAIAYYLFSIFFKIICVGLFSPTYLFAFFYSLTRVIFSFFFSFFFIVYNRFISLFFKFFSFFILFSLEQFLFHFKSFLFLKGKFFRKYYYYRRVYRLTLSVKILVKSILTVERNGLLINHYVQPLKSISPKFLSVLNSYTTVGYNFRVLRRFLKLVFSTFTLFYFIQLFVRLFFFYVTVYVVNLIKFLRRKNFITSKSIVTKNLLKFLVFLKLVFVWPELPFILMFKPGVSKKYSQYEDIQPDLFILNENKWDFALSRDCYFDYENVLNGFYIFHIFRKISKLFFNLIVFFFIGFYVFLVNAFSMMQALYFLFYIPFKFVYLNYFFSFLILLFKVPVSFFYLLFVFLFLFLFAFTYFIFKFAFLKFRFFYAATKSYCTTAGVPFFFSFLRVRSFSFLSYFIFRIRKANFLLFKKLVNLFSFFGLFNFLNNKKFNNLFNTELPYLNSLFYNSSFVFKRINPYFLRVRDFQFLAQFRSSNFFSRVTPDQFEAFKKIGLNSRYPLFYFEKMFDLEYSRLELEYESPYYWSFVRQMYFGNEGLLHPRFHVYGLINFIKFYWSYFCFLNANLVFSFDSKYAHDFIQLLNSSASRVVGCLVNDFFKMLGFKKIVFYRNSFYLKLLNFKQTSGLHFFHVKYYEKLLYFFWTYFDSIFNKFLFYYTVINNSSSLKSYSFFNFYAEKARHILYWFVFSFYERLMGKIFISTNKFEDYYEFNFDNSVSKYNFYMSHLKLFFGLRFNSKTKKFSPNSENLPNNVKKSVRFAEYEVKLAAQRKKDYLDTVSDFFTGSFTLFGHFYVFVRDNIFEFISSWHIIWREYVDSAVTRWASFKKISSFIFWFLKFSFLILFFVLFLVLFFGLFIFKGFTIILIKKIKNLYV